MTPRIGVFGLAVALGMTPACGGGVTASDTASAPVVSAASHATEVETWRAEHEASYRRNYVTIAGLHPLRPGANTAGSAASNDVVLPDSTPAAIGRFILTDGRVRFEPAPGGAPVTLGGTSVTGPVDLRSDAEAEPDELVIGDVRLVVHPSGTEQMIRVRDPHGTLATGFLGFTWFPIDPGQRVIGRWIPDAAPKALRVVNTYGDVDDFQTEGVVEFTLQGQTLRLRPFTTRPGRLWFVFRDGSSGAETYEAARFLYADLQPDGTAVLDFNMAYNPPCAFNPYTTCPIPLPENRLSTIRILAGEKAYPVKLELPVKTS